MTTIGTIRASSGVDEIVRGILTAGLDGRALADHEQACLEPAVEAVATILVMDAYMRLHGPLTDEQAEAYVDATRDRDCHDARVGARRPLQGAEEYALTTTTELQIAQAVAAGALPSPTEFLGSEYFAVRISGTGAAVRASEFVFRNPAIWLSGEMQRRILGLPVLADHPPQGTLDSKEFAARVIGIVVYAFVRADEEELWGVMRVIDREAAAAMADGEYDSSPAVIFAQPNDNFVVELEDGGKLLCEGVPSQIDHVAICARGVWTKPGADPGVEITEQPMEQAK